MISFASLVFLSSFLYLLNCLYLEPRVFLAFAVPTLSAGRERGRRVSGCVGAWLLAKVNPLHMVTSMILSSPVFC